VKQASKPKPGGIETDKKAASPESNIPSPRSPVLTAGGGVITTIIKPPHVRIAE